MGGISIWQLLIVLGIVVLLFGTKKLRGLGTDLGGAIKGFKKAVSDEEQKSDDKTDDPASLKQEKTEAGQETEARTDQSKTGQ